MGYMHGYPTLPVGCSTNGPTPLSNMVVTGQELVRGKKFFKVRENWHFEEKSGKIEILRLN